VALDAECSAKKRGWWRDWARRPAGFGIVGDFTPLLLLPTIVPFNRAQPMVLILTRDNRTPSNLKNDLDHEASEHIDADAPLSDQFKQHQALQLGVRESLERRQQESLEKFKETEDYCCRGRSSGYWSPIVAGQDQDHGLGPIEGHNGGQQQ